jgi:hypothetical protein
MLYRLLLLAMAMEVSVVTGSSESPSFLLAVLGVRPERWGFVKKQIQHLKSTIADTNIDFHCSVSLFDLDFYEKHFEGVVASKLPLGCTYIYTPGKYSHQMMGVRNVDSYDFVGAMVDDVDVAPTNSHLDFRIPFFLEVMQKFQFDVASPAMVNYNIKNKLHLQPHHQCLAREVLLLDHLLDVFTKEAFLCLQAQLRSAIDINYYGWTYVPMLSYTCNCKFGVIDQQNVEHVLKEIQNRKRAHLQKDAYLSQIFKNASKESLKAFYARRHELDQIAAEHGCEGMRNVTDDSYVLLNMTLAEYRMKKEANSAHKEGSSSALQSCETNTAFVLFVLFLVVGILCLLQMLQHRNGSNVHHKE